MTNKEVCLQFKKSLHSWQNSYRMQKCGKIQVR